MPVDQPLRVLFLIDSLRMGGAETVTVALLRHFDRTRVNPLICTLNKRGESPLGQQLGDVPRFDLGAKRMIDPAALWRLRKLVKQEKVDLIHAQLSDSTILAILAGKMAARVPVITTRHLMEDTMKNWRQRWRTYLERFLMRLFIDRIIAVSDAASKSYQEQTGIAAKRFQTIYNGIDLERFGRVEDKNALRQELGLPTDGILITMVGVLRPGKGQEVAIAAAKNLQGIHLLLVGDGKPPQRANLEALAQGFENSIHFLGQRMDVPQILKASDILILPSDQEALPTVLIEAGASALPSVATRVGGIPEVIVDGETGILIPPQNPAALTESIQKLLSDPQQIKTMGENAYQHVHQHFTLAGQAEVTTRLYEEIIRARRKA